MVLNYRSVALIYALLFFSMSTHASEGSKSMELVVDHVMFPVYANNELLESIEAAWNEKGVGRVFTQPQNEMFKGVYIQSKNFYVEYLSTVETQPYWSNAVYIVVDKQYWSHYENPVMVNEHFLIPSFGSGYQLVSPDYPYLNSKSENTGDYEGLEILISEALHDELLNIAGRQWTLPSNGKVRVHDGLHHLHDIVVIDDSSKLVAPLYEANPILRDYF